jgi:hypothetical protein
MAGMRLRVRFGLGLVTDADTGGFPLMVAGGAGSVFTTKARQTTA